MGRERKDGSVVEIEEIALWLDERLQGYTLREGHGVWQGTREPCVCILIAGLEPDDLAQLACDAAQAFDQVSVGLLIQSTYTRILPVAPGRPVDQVRLSRFKQLLDQGVAFEDLPVELRTWWKNRY